MKAIIGCNKKDKISRAMKRLMEENSKALKLLIKLPKNFFIHIRPYKRHVDTLKI